MRRYRVVWQILNALRAHDERFDATINKIDLGQDDLATRSRSSPSMHESEELRRHRSRPEAAEQDQAATFRHRAGQRRSRRRWHRQPTRTGSQPEMRFLVRRIRQARSWPRSSRSAATATTGKTGPPTSPRSPKHHITRMTGLLERPETPRRARRSRLSWPKSAMI